MCNPFAHKNVQLRHCYLLDRPCESNENWTNIIICYYLVPHSPCGSSGRIQLWQGQGWLRRRRRRAHPRVGNYCSCSSFCHPCLLLLLLLLPCTNARERVVNTCTCDKTCACLFILVCAHLCTDLHKMLTYANEIEIDHHIKFHEDLSFRYGYIFKTILAFV